MDEGKESSAREARAKILVYYLKAHQDPGHRVPAGVGRCVGRCPGERPGVPGGGSLGILKTERFWDAFWDAFWMAFGGPDPPKLSSRLGETLILIKSPFSAQVRFLMKSQAHKAP